MAESSDHQIAQMDSRTKLDIMRLSASTQSLLAEDYSREVEVFERVVNIVNTMNKEKIHQMFNEFQEAPKNRMKMDEFRRTLAIVAGIHMLDSEFYVLFKKMDSKRDEFIDWDEFVSHLMLEFQEKEMSSHKQSLQSPIQGHPKVIRSGHRLPVATVTFNPATTQDRKVNYLQGKYMTMSRDGMINYWSVDFDLERTVHSVCPYLNVHPTWVTDLVCLPDVNIVCTSSAERDLRFYDTSANKFELRVMISRWDTHITKMYYHFYENPNEESILILGDGNGNIRILLIDSRDKGPFYHIPGIDLTHIWYEDLLRGALKGMKIVEHRNIHSTWVSQVSYYVSFKYFISCAVCPTNSLYCCDILGTKTNYSFNLEKGVSCFNFSEESHIIVTGSPDCKVRVWSLFVQKKPRHVFFGHKTTVVSITLQDAGQKIFSLSKDKTIKVWDLTTQSCIQTYNGMPAELGERTALVSFYNPLNRNLIVASMKIAIIICCEQINLEDTDGFTHTKAVSKALYNHLFKVLVTVGHDSSIMVWDPWVGLRLLLIRNAHSHVRFGQVRPSEITAAAYSPDWQRLITGARDGSLKIWDFNSGMCMRTMGIDPECEVTGVVWIPNRIMASGWNRHVEEFDDKGKEARGKVWESRHSEDIMSMVCRPPEALATVAYNGEVVLWRLETGQPYKAFELVDPSTRKTSFETSGKSHDSKPSKSSVASTVASSSIMSASAGESQADTPQASSSTVGGDQSAEEPGTPRTLARRPRRTTVVALPALGKGAHALHKTTAAHATLILDTRPMRWDTGTLLVSLDSGHVQVWSHHQAGWYIGSFFTGHVTGDYVLAMATDPRNQFLFTGSSVGYIKVWLLENYGLPYEVKVCMPLLRLKFPFLLSDRIDGRAKRTFRDQPLPLLLSSYRAHLRGINHLEFLPGCEIIVSCSFDRTVRLWTLSGQYLSTLGTPKSWVPLVPHLPPPAKRELQVPPDVVKRASSTTLKVLKGGKVFVSSQKRRDDSDVIKEIPQDLLDQGTHGKRATSPILGKHFKLPNRIDTPAHYPVLDTSLPVTPVYCFLKCDEIEEVPKLPAQRKDYFKKREELKDS